MRFFFCVFPVCPAQGSATRRTAIVQRREDRVYCRSMSDNAPSGEPQSEPDSAPEPVEPPSKKAKGTSFTEGMKLLFMELAMLLSTLSHCQIVTIACDVLRPIFDANRKLMREAQTDGEDANFAGAIAFEKRCLTILDTVLVDKGEMEDRRRNFVQSELNHGDDNLSKHFLALNETDREYVTSVLYRMPDPSPLDMWNVIRHIEDITTEFQGRTMKCGDLKEATKIAQKMVMVECAMKRVIGMQRDPVLFTKFTNAVHTERTEARATWAVLKQAIPGLRKSSPNGHAALSLFSRTAKRLRALESIEEKTHQAIETVDQIFRDAVAADAAASESSSSSSSSGNAAPAGTIVCENCQNEGHCLRDCPQPELCRRCLAKDHDEPNCPVRAKDDTVRASNTGVAAVKTGGPATVIIEDDDPASNSPADAGHEGTPSPPTAKPGKQVLAKFEKALDDASAKWMQQQSERHTASNGAIPWQCFNCKGSDHNDWECKRPPQCFWCGHAEHGLRDCPRLRIQEVDRVRGDGQFTCMVCRTRRKMYLRCSRCLGTFCAACGVEGHGCPIDDPE